MPGKVSGFSLYFQAVILAASMKNRGGLFRLLSLTFSLCLQTLSAWLYFFSFFPKKGKFMLHFLPHCVQILRHLLALAAISDLSEMCCFAFCIYTYEWWFTFLGGSSFPPFSTPFCPTSFCSQQKC